MIRIGTLSLILGLGIAQSFAQASAPPPGPLAGREQTAIAPGTHSVGRGSFPLQVVKTLDSSKLKPGDPVEFKTAGAFLLRDGTRVAEGTRVTGHVTQATARSNGAAESQLSVAFEQIQLNKKKQLSLKAVLQAVGAAPAEGIPSGESGATMAKQSGPGGAGWTPTTDVKSGSNTQVVEQAPPTLTPESTGVQGIQGLQLGADGVIRSSGKSVKLAPGTRIIVRAEIFD